MNIFNCFNNMQISRYAAIKYAQLMANSNLITLFNGATNNGWGVLTSIAGTGLLSASDTALKVSRKAGSTTKIEIQPGVAITPDGQVAINYRTTALDVEALIGSTYGLYYLYIKHTVEYLMTGEETFYTGHTSSTLGTIERDYCEFELTQTPTSEYVLLATIWCVNGPQLIPDEITVADANLAEGTVIYPDDTDVAWTGIAAITGDPLFAFFPYVLVGNEYLENTGVDQWDRAMYSTNGDVYYAGNHSMKWSPIIDQRQTNCLRLAVQINELDLALDGIVEKGSGIYRHLELIAKKTVPTTPVISTTNSEIIWLNSHLAAGYLTADMVAAYEEVQGVQESINNTLSIINQLKIDYAEAGNDTTTQERLLYEIQKQQMALMDYRTKAANLKSKLATRTMDSIRYTDLRQFAYAVSIEEATHSDDIDEPVMYEVEVEYGIADAPKENVASVVRRWFYSRRRNVEEIDWSNMERTYEDEERTSNSYNNVYVPIKFGERIKFRVRAIGESGQPSAFTAYNYYSFTGYTVSQQYVMVNNIYNLLYPDPYQEGIITRELVELLNSVIEDYRDKTNRIVAIEAQIASLEEEVQ